MRTILNVSIVTSLSKPRFDAIAFIGELKDIFKRAAKYGYDGVELSLLDPKDLKVSVVKALCEEYKIKVPAFSTGLNYLHEGLSLTDPKPNVRKKAVARLKDFVEVAHKLSSGVVIGLMRGKVVGGVKYEVAYTWLIEGLQELCEYAEKFDVKIFFEPLNRYETNIINTVDEGLKLIEDVGSKSLYLLLDTFHMNIEEAIVEESIKKASSRLGHFHVADSNRLAPGLGHIDFKSIIKTLLDIKYEGFLSAEILPKPSPEEAAKIAIENLRKIFREIV
ncbi:MAG: sugar phosphate isomerase/epimerase [Thermoprotei archaeon]|nr:MAG: sugar phosphate isomerase/epimerase [Thermoprotei archaeon]RLF02158.1 MAG: sugar phosphate isomerase/epimerase [Thermoprotei archaeon]